MKFITNALTISSLATMAAAGSSASYVSHIKVRNHSIECNIVPNNFTSVWFESLLTVDPTVAALFLLRVER